MTPAPRKRSLIVSPDRKRSHSRRLRHRRLREIIKQRVNHPAKLFRQPAREKKLANAEKTFCFGNGSPEGLGVYGDSSPPMESIDDVDMTDAPSGSPSAPPSGKKRSIDNNDVSETPLRQSRSLSGSVSGSPSGKKRSISDHDHYVPGTPSRKRRSPDPTPGKGGTSMETTSPLRRHRRGVLPLDVSSDLPQRKRRVMARSSLRMMAIFRNNLPFRGNGPGPRQDI
ncbi:hypothetical protein DL771_003624 [Monosporascus sp. 5C6A]|nr:hypothetical protein DL771_003624 [Monosporascus sp. 5C6A]